MVKRIGFVVALLLWFAGGTGCRSAQGTFEGTWKRIGLFNSTISLREGEDGYHFRWLLVDGEKNIRCTRDDFCEEFRGEDKVYEYSFELEHKGDEIVIRAQGRPMVDEMEAVSWVDRMTLYDGGRELWSFLLEMDGEKLPSPLGPIRFTRTSDVPF